MIISTLGNIGIFSNLKKRSLWVFFFVDQLLQPKNEKTNIPFDSMSSGDVYTWEFAEWNKRSFKYQVVNQEKKTSISPFFFTDFEPLCCSNKGGGEKKQL